MDDDDQRRLYSVTLTCVDTPIYVPIAALGPLPARAEGDTLALGGLHLNSND